MARVPNNPIDAVAAVVALQSSLTSSQTNITALQAFQTLLEGVVTSDAAGTLGTLAAAKMINGTLIIASGTSSTVTTDSAADIIAALNGQTMFLFAAINEGSGSLVFTPGASVTMSPSASETLATVSYSVWLGVVTSASTVQLLKLVATTY